MKNKVMHLAVGMAVALAALPAALFAEITATDISTLAYAVYVPSDTTSVGDKVPLPLCMKNAKSIVGWQADLVLPQGFTLAKDTHDNPMVTVSGTRTTSADHTVSSKILADGSCRILYKTSSNKAIAGKDGEVATLTLCVDENVKTGVYPITLQYIVLSEADQTGHKVKQVTTPLTIINGDPIWSWSDDGKNAKALCASEQGSPSVQWVNATVAATVKIPATCTKMGVSTYTATVEWGKQTYTSSKDVEDIPATHHQYLDPVWTWTDYVAAEALFACVHGDDSLTVQANITTGVKTPATCTAMGVTAYTATVQLGGLTYTDTKEVLNIPILGHSYGEPVWTWSANGKTAVVRFICKHDTEHIQQLDATVTSAVKEPATYTSKGTTTYTAMVTFEGKAYSSAKDVQDIPMLRYTYGNPSWKWSEDGKNAQAIFTSIEVPSHAETLVATVTSAVKISATCTTMGTTTYTAIVNFEGKNYSSSKEVQDIPALDHAYGKPAWTWAENGKSAKAIFPCAHDTTHVESIEAIVKSAVKIPATCMEMGTTTYTAAVTFKDSTYTATKDVQDIPAIGHAYGDPVWEWSADGQTATATFTCAHHSEHTEVLEAVVTSAVKTPATCTEQGTTTYTATVTLKNSTYTATKDVQDIPAIGHSYGDPAWNWSADGQSATATFSCAHDSKHTEVLEATVKSALTTPPTCTEKGTTTYTATVTFKDSTYTATKDVQDIPAIGHTYGDPVWNWSADGQTATATFTCTNDSKHIEVLEAAVTSVLKTPATCTGQGTTTYTATVTFKDSTYTATKDIQDIPAIGHAYGGPAWNWSSDGQTATATFTCSHDSKHIEVLEAVVTSALTTPPTCTEKGITTYTATVTFEGETYTSTKDVQDIPAIGHTYGDPVWNWSEDGQTATATFTCTHDSKHTEVLEAAVTSAVKTPAACTEMGTTLYTATVTFLEKTYTSTKEVQDIPATGHLYVYTDNGDGTHTVSCSLCDMEPYSEAHQCEEGVCIHCHACPVTALALSADSTLIEIGDTLTLVATITPLTATNQHLTWTSSDEAVATVADGIVTAVGEGTATITVTACDGSGVSAACTVTVVFDLSLSPLVRPEDTPAYTLQGFRATPQTLGIIIQNGKKQLRR